MSPDDGPRPTFLGRLLTFVLVAALIGGGLYMVRDQLPLEEMGLGGIFGETTPGDDTDSDAKPAVADDAAEDAADGAATVDVQAEVPRLDMPAPYEPSGGVIEIEISEYAGYAGLIAANGGLAPNENSLFMKNGGFKVKLSVSEEESWSKLNRGAIAASTTTVDVIAVYGRQFRVVVPALIGFSRGADGIDVLSAIKRINQLTGKVIATAQFTEVDFLIRYLAGEAGIPINLLGSLDDRPDPDAINLVFTEDGFTAGDLFLHELETGSGKLAGAVTWEPKLTEVVAQSSGKAHTLTTNRNLLIIADILVVNRGFAEQHPDMVQAIVKSLLEGNQLVRDDPDSQLDVIGRAFGWNRDKTKQELGKVHLANLPENLAFFSGEIDAAGSFNGIYQSAVLAYGNVIRDPIDGERFVDVAALQALEASGAFRNQKIAIAPIRSKSSGAIENDPLLTKDIRFYFEPNSAKLDLKSQQNLQDLASIAKLLQVSPGSTILLRGHVDNSLVEEFRRQGGEPFVRQMALKAMELSKNRANEVKRLVIERHGVDPGRLEIVGRGWEESAGTDAELNRRVEVQWFTLE